MGVEITGSGSFRPVRNGRTVPLDVPVMRLSIAEQQMVEIGRAVAIGCRVLVLDEPTSSLTKKDIVHLFDLVRWPFPAPLTTKSRHGRRQTRRIQIHRAGENR